MNKILTIHSEDAFHFNNLVFEWDAAKDQSNFAKHGIHFKTAVKVFWDPQLLIRRDEEHGKELRYNVLGRVGKVLFVVFTKRRGNTIRMISARLATSGEKVRYEYGTNEYE